MISCFQFALSVFLILYYINTKLCMSINNKCLLSKCKSLKWFLNDVFLFNPLSNTSERYYDKMVCIKIVRNKYSILFLGGQNLSTTMIKNIQQFTKSLRYKYNRSKFQ